MIFMDTTTIVILLAVYIFVLVAIWRWVSRGESTEGFLLADRQIGFWRMFLSRSAGAIWAGTFIALWAYAYQFGIWTYAYIVWVAIWYTLFAFFAIPKIVEYAREKKFYTIGDFIFSRIDNVLVKKITDILVVIISTLWAFSQIIMWALVISYFGNISYEWALLLTGGVVSTYLILWWFKAILATDVIQLILIVILWIFVWYIAYANADIVMGQVSFEHMEITVMIGFLLYGIFEPYANGNMYQMCYAAKDMKTAQKWILVWWIPTAIIASIVLLIWFAVRSYSHAIDPQLAFLVWVWKFLSPFWVSVTIVILFASLMSTLDSLIYASASHLAFLLPIKKNNKKLLVRILIIVLLIGMMVMWLFINNVVAISIIVASTGAWLLSPAIISLLAGNNDARSFLWSVILWIAGMWLGIFIRWIDPKIFIPILVGWWLWLLIRDYDTWLLMFKLRNISRLLKAIPQVIRFKRKSWRRR